MFNRVSAAVLIVEDLEQCMVFYRDAVGLQVVFTDSDSVAFRMQDQDFALLKVAAAADMISEAAVSANKEAGRRVLLCADVENADAAYTTLTSQGVQFIKPPISQPWGFRTAYFADPEGNLWEIRQTIPSEQS